MVLLLSTTSTRHYSFPKHFVLFLYVEWFCKSFWRESLTVQVAYLHKATRTLSSPSRWFQLSIIYIIIIKSWQRFLSLSLVLWKKKQIECGIASHWWNSTDFWINWHVFNQSECRNCCLYIIIQKLAPQAKSGKYFQIWFSPRFGGGGEMAAFWACACKLFWTLLLPARVQLPYGVGRKESSGTGLEFSMPVSLKERPISWELNRIYMYLICYFWRSLFYLQ